MSVPEEVRRVPRPRNTVVLDTGSKGPTRYAVRARAKSVYITGLRTQHKFFFCHIQTSFGPFKAKSPPTFLKSANYLQALYFLTI